MADPVSHRLDLCVGGKYRLSKKIGSGSFESLKAKHAQLEYKLKVYKTLAGGVGVPFVQW
ncbi:hypothetical protein L208DRAFT_1065981, partial [Tricholoma matsutake]